MVDIVAKKNYLIKLISAIDDEMALALLRELIEKISHQDELATLLTKPIYETMEV